MKIYIISGELKKEIYIEGVYKQPVKNIVDYEKTLTVDEAIAQSETEYDRIAKMKAKLDKRNKTKKKKIKFEVEDEDDKSVNNQILNFGNKQIKKE